MGNAEYMGMGIDLSLCKMADERVTTQPEAHQVPHFTPDVQPVDEFGGNDGRRKAPSWQHIKHKWTSKEGWIGEFPLSYICTPQLPCSFRGKRSAKPTPFYALDADMPIMAAVVCGLQHCLAMLAGLITPPLIMSTQLGFDSQTQNQMVAVSLIVSGLLSAVQITRFRIPRTKYFVGTGLITVVGTSFATLSVASSIFNALYANGTCPSETVDGVVTRLACPEAYGYLLGTQAVCSLFLMAMSFVGPKVLHKVFPPVVTGLVVLLLGASLVGKSGVLNWAGGSNPCQNRPEEGFFSVCPNMAFDGVKLPWGDARYLGLGLLSFSTILILEFVGSPFVRSASNIIGLLVGCIVAAPLGYTSPATIESAPAITFLWVQTFPLKVYGPAVLPILAVYIALACEATGDITASSEASREPIDGPLFDSRVQGGILADGINSCISGLMMNPPVAIFSQNNGVIAITRCANRTAGYVCCGFLLLFGIIAKISGVFLAIPNSVLGGVTTFLFATVATSGLRVIAMCSFDRRERIILAAAGGLGMASLLHPEWVSYMFTYSGSNEALRGFMDAIVVILETPFLVAGIMASFLNGTLPKDAADTVVHAHHDEDVEGGAQSSSRKDSVGGSEPSEK